MCCSGREGAPVKRAEHGVPCAPCSWRRAVGNGCCALPLRTRSAQMGNVRYVHGA